MLEISEERLRGILGVGDLEEIIIMIFLVLEVVILIFYWGWVVYIISSGLRFWDASFGM